jgi:hypothetical protein
LFGPYNLKHRSKNFIKYWTQRKTHIFNLLKVNKDLKKEYSLIESIL